MLKKYNLFVIIGILFTLIFGTLLHFTYEWSGNNSIVGLFAPISESVWEHMKLLFYPYTIWSAIGYFFYGKRNRSYWISAFAGLSLGLCFIPICFFTYVSYTNSFYPAVDITIFLIAVIISFLFSSYLFKNYNLKTFSTKTIIIFWELLFLLFVIFTLYTPDLKIFHNFS